MRSLFLLLLIASLTHGSVSAAQMSEQQRRGEQIYLTGKSPSSQDIQARLNDSGAQLPATLMPCVNCHQHDGKGVTEGGITPADIRWFNLTKPYGIGQAGETIRAPYTKRSVKKAITMGIGSSGQKLNPVMPRYQMSLNDMNDLLAYLEGLGSYQARGISNQHINIGVLLPANNQAKAQAVQQVLSAWFKDLAQQGGIYQRQLRPQFIQVPNQLSPTNLAQFKRTLEQADAFAFVASHIEGIETLISEFSQQHALPVIGAFTSTPKLDFPLNRQIFYLLSGQQRQTLALQHFAQQMPVEGQKTAVVVNNKNDLAAMLKQLQSQQSLSIIELQSELEPQWLKTHDLVYLLVEQQQQSQFFDLAAAIDWWPKVLLPGAQMNPMLFNNPPQFDQRVFVAMPNLPSDYKQSGIGLYQRLQQNYPLSRQYQNSQLLALAAVMVLKEGLTKTGRTLQQSKLLSMVEGLYRFDTGLTRQLSYGPNRRVGATGAYIVAVDLVNKTIRPASHWLETK